jgi:predicted nucleic acid-binding protein
MRAYVDSDVLIWHLRGDRRALEFLRELKDNPDYELWTGAMQRAEVTFFMRPEEEERTLLLLSLFKTAPVDQSVVDKAGQLFRTYHPSHGIDTNDALLAATAMLTGGKVHTLNVKHYPMPELVVAKAFE